MITTTKKQGKQYVISFVLPVLILLLIYMVWGQYPFGDKTLLIWDMDEQYAPFFAHLHDILHGDASALYTFSRALGGNMLSVAAYYLISPFNLVFYFFDAENIYAGILIVTLLKTGSCGVAMFWFLNRKKQDFSAVIFAIAYALSAYMIGYLFNIFWIDAVILLPFVCGGIERLVDERKYLLYTLAIALAVITNFYTGYMICIFSVLYFLCYFLFISDKKYRVKTFLTYIGASFLGGMLSMCVSLPTLDIMRGGKAGFSLGILKNFKNMFKYEELMDAAFCGTISNKQISAGKPLIYCGVFAIIMAVYWLACQKEAVRKKLAYLLLLFIIVISFHHYNLNCVWHVFNRPVGSPYRYSFIYIFLLLYMAYKGYTALSDASIFTKYDMRVMLGTGLTLILLLLARIPSFMENEKTVILAVNIILTVLYVVLIFIIKNRKVRNLLILFCTCAELFINAECLYTVSSQYDSISVSEYQDYMESMQPLVESIKEAGKESGGIYRTAIERGLRRTSNDPFMFGLYGMDSYTSVEKQNVIQIAGNFGYSNNILWGMHYNNGATKAGDSFLGVKYLISDENPGSGYNMVEESDAAAVYENENVLPLAFLADKSIMEAHSLENPFQYMNELYHALDTQVDEDIFVKLDGDFIESSNCDKLEDGGWQISKGAGEDAEKSAYLEYEFETESAVTVYTRYDRAGVSAAEVFIGEDVINLDSQVGDVKCIGALSEGTRFKLRCYLPEDGILSPDKIYVYGEKENILKACAADAAGQRINITVHDEARIDISCINEDNEPKCLICTIPYDKGWRIKIDGQKTAALDVQNFVAVPVEGGGHEIELEFVPSGLYPGIIMTLVSVLVLLYMNRNLISRGLV